MNNDQQLIWEAYLTEGIPSQGHRENDPYGSSRDEFIPGVDDETRPHRDETTSTGKDIIAALEQDPEYHIQEDKRNEDIRMVVFGHVDKAITLEVLSKGQTVVFVQIKWMFHMELERNKDYGPDKIAKGPLTIMVDLEKIKEQAMNRH
jgi:hypothetical protein